MKRTNKNPLKQTVRFVDLFAGIGGLRKGLEGALQKHGIQSECVFSCELNKRARETYELNFNRCPDGDIRQVASLPDHDVLLGGFPCQAFSCAGKKKGFADTRGTLFFEVERLISKTTNKPRLLLLENVRGFTTHDGGRTFATVKDRLEQLGYVVQALILNSSNFSVPQNRVRVYLVCSLGDKASLTIQSDVGASDSHKFKQNMLQGSLFQSSRFPTKHVRDILETQPATKYACSADFTKQLRRALSEKPFESLHGVRLIDYRGGNSLHSWDLGSRGLCTKEERAFLNALIENRRKKCFGQHKDGKSLTLEQIKIFWSQENLPVLLSTLVKKGYLRREREGRFNPTCGNMSFEVFKFLDPDSVSITVVSSDADRLGVVAEGAPRRITPRECARLQGFSDDFILHPLDSCAYHQLGNSVSVPVVSAIFEDLIENGSGAFPESRRQSRGVPAINSHPRAGLAAA